MTVGFIGLSSLDTIPIILTSSDCQQRVQQEGAATPGVNEFGLATDGAISGSNHIAAGCTERTRWLPLVLCQPDKMAGIDVTIFSFVKSIPVAFFRSGTGKLAVPQEMPK